MRALDLRVPVVLSVPLAAAILELFHPKAPLAQLFTDGALLDRWLAVHVLQLFAFALVAACVYLLISGRQSPAARLTRLAMGGFAVFYGAYDALAGIATGVLAANARDLGTAAQAGAVQGAQDLFTSMERGAYAWIGLLGTFFWVFGVLSAAIALARPRWPALALGLALVTAFASTFGKSEIWRGFVIVMVLAAGSMFLVTLVGRRISWVPVALLSLSAAALTSGHPAPFGTITFGSLWLATLWLELAGRQALAPGAEPAPSAPFPS